METIRIRDGKKSDPGQASRIRNTDETHRKIKERKDREGIN